MRTQYGQFMNCPYFRAYYKSYMQLSKNNVRTTQDRPYQNFGGGERVRTDDPLRARQVLSQLSYTPDWLVGLGGLEPPTSRLSVVCSSQLSYRPLYSEQ